MRDYDKNQSNKIDLREFRTLWNEKLKGKIEEVNKDYLNL